MNAFTDAPGTDGIQPARSEARGRGRVNTWGTTSPAPSLGTGAHVDFLTPRGFATDVWCGNAWQPLVRSAGVVVCGGCGADISERVKA